MRISDWSSDVCSSDLFASRITNGQPPLIFEDGEQRRDFVHVRDVARAFRAAMEKPAAADRVINIGSGRSYTVSQVARLLAEAMGSDIRPEIMRKARAGDIRNCFADITRAQDLLDFRPKHLMEESLGELAGREEKTEADNDRERARRE